LEFINNLLKEKDTSQSNILKIGNVKINVHRSFTPRKSLSEALFTLANMRLKEKFT